MQNFNERAREVKDYPKKQQDAVQVISEAERKAIEQEKGIQEQTGLDK